MSMKSRGAHSSFSPVLNRPSLLPFTLRFPPPCLLGSIRGRFSQRVIYQSPFPSCSRSSSYLLIVSCQWFLWICLRNLLTKLCILFDMASVTFQVLKLWVALTLEVNIRGLIFVGNDEAFQPGLIEGVKRQSGFVFSALQIFLHNASDCDIILPR